MNPELELITAKVAALGRRERALALLSVGFVLLAVGFAAWSVGMVLGHYGVSRAVARQGLLGAGGAILFLIFSWTFSSLRRAANPLHQAERVENLLPELRGRVLLSLERKAGAEGQESPLLLALAAKRAAAMVAPLEPRRVYPIDRLVTPAALVAATALVWLVLGVVLPMGPLGTLRWLGGDAQALMVEPAAPALPDEALALVGELVLRYEYPEYTGLPALEVPNSNGTAHGPPGTRVSVRARTAEVFDNAALVAYEAEPVLADLSGGRDLSAAFTIGEKGVWRLLLRRGAVQQQSPDFAIEPEPDLPPVVEVESASDRIEVALDQVIPVQWRVRDDYGVSLVQAKVRKGKTVELRKPITPTPVLPGELGRTPRDLGLKAGDEAILTVVGWDNDAVSKPKMGESRPIRVVVLGPKAQQLRFLVLRRELRDALVDVLADFKLDPAPLGGTQREVDAWAASAAGRFEPVDALVDQYWDAFDVRSLEGRLVEEIRRQGSALLRFAQAIGSSRSATLVPEADAMTLAELHETLVGTLEVDVLMLDMMVRYKAVRELYGQARTLRSAGASLRADAESGAGADTLYAGLDRVESLSEAMAAAAKDFDASGLGELVGDSVDDIHRLDDAIRQRIAAGDMNGARGGSVQLSRQLDHLLATLEAMQSEMEEASEKDQEQMKKFIEELERLESEERALLEATQQAVESAGGDSQNLVDAWREAERLAGEVQRLSAAMRVGVEADGDARYPPELEAVRRLDRQAERVTRAVTARDTTSAGEENMRVMLELRRTDDSLTYGDRRRAVASAQPLRSQEKALDVAYNDAVRLDELLRQLSEEMNQASPSLAGKAAELAATQRGLHEDVGEALPTAREIAEQLPMGAPGLVESLEGAEREMARANKALDRSRGVEAEGAEEAAADRIRQALEALAQASAAMDSLQDAMEGGDDGTGAEGGQPGRESDGDRVSGGPIELPNPEEFRTPEEYREALLRGMQGEVPPEYEALKRRYYEELVRQ